MAIPLDFRDAVDCKSCDHTIIFFNWVIKSNSLATDDARVLRSYVINPGKFDLFLGGQLPFSLQKVASKFSTIIRTNHYSDNYFCRCIANVDLCVELLGFFNTMLSDSSLVIDWMSKVKRAIIPMTFSPHDVRGSH